MEASPQPGTKLYIVETISRVAIEYIKDTLLQPAYVNTIP